jgi:hypothetical protein
VRPVLVRLDVNGMVMVGNVKQTGAHFVPGTLFLSI